MGSGTGIPGFPGMEPDKPKLKPPTAEEIASMNLGDLRKHSREAMAIATFYPASFVLPVDTLVNRLEAARAEQNPVLKIARFAHAANHTDVVNNPDPDKKAESFIKDWRAAMEKGQAQTAIARQIVAEAEEAAKRQPAESIEMMRKRQREKRPLHVVEGPARTDAKGNPEANYQAVMPTLNRFYDTAEGQGTKEGKKAVAGKFDWGAVLAMIVATINKKTHQADNAWEKDMKEFAAMKPSGLEIEAFRDPSTGQLTFQGKNKGLTREQSSEVAEEFNLYLKEKYKNNKHGAVSVHVKDSTTRVEVDLSTGGRGPAATTATAHASPASPAPAAGG